jgi:hypothetical protein
VCLPFPASSLTLAKWVDAASQLAISRVMVSSVVEGREALLLTTAATLLIPSARRVS